VNTFHPIADEAKNPLESHLFTITSYLNVWLAIADPIRSLSVFLLSVRMSDAWEMSLSPFSAISLDAISYLMTNGNDDEFLIQKQHGQHIGLGTDTFKAQKVGRSS
jgi:hypothetical protein